MGWGRTLFDRAPLFAHTLPRPGRIAGVSVTAARFVRDTTLLSLAAVGSALAHEPDVFIVENPRVWIEEENAVVLVTLVNKEDKRVQIVGGISPAAERVELRLRTKAVASIEVAARGSLKLGSGGRTTALLKLPLTWKTDELVPVRLRLDDGNTFRSNGNGGAMIGALHETFSSNALSTLPRTPGRNRNAPAKESGGNIEG